MAGYTELTIEQGANFSSDVVIRDATNTLINLSSHTASSQMRKSYYSTTSISLNASISDGPGGTVSLSLSALESANIKPGRYVYDVLIELSGEVTRVVEGIITVLPSVTR
jgi:hypothetical protein